MKADVDADEGDNVERRQLVTERLGYATFVGTVMLGIAVVSMYADQGNIKDDVHEGVQQTLENREHINENNREVVKRLDRIEEALRARKLLEDR